MRLDRCFACEAAKQRLFIVGPMLADADIDTDLEEAAHDQQEASGEEKATIAQYIDKQLEEEFKNEELASLSKTDLNETMAKEKVRGGSARRQCEPRHGQAHTRRHRKQVTLG